MDQSVFSVGDHIKASAYDANLIKFKRYGRDRLPRLARSEVVVTISPIAFRPLGCDEI
jgi:hypothetical protein